MAWMFNAVFCRIKWLLASGLGLCRINLRSCLLEKRARPTMAGLLAGVKIKRLSPKVPGIQGCSDLSGACWLPQHVHQRVFQ